MALSRKFLKSLGLEDEKIESIIEAHTESTDALKKERDEWKQKAEGMDALTKERDELKAKLDKAPDAAKVQAEYDAYKRQVEGEKTEAAKKAALRKALKDAGVQREPFENLLMRTVDMSKLEMDGDKIKDVDTLINSLKSDYAECFSTTTTQGTPPATPPTGGKSTMTRADILKIKDTAERQKAIAENHELFGI